MAQTGSKPAEYRQILSQKNDEDKLAAQHRLIKDGMGGKLLEMESQLASGPLKILDSATADGFWLRDLALDFAHTSGNTYVGTDMSRDSFPAEHAGDFEYHVQDIRAAWPDSWAQTFDVVHQRAVLVVAGTAAELAVQRLYELVKPGGWIQLVEGNDTLDARNGPAMTQLFEVMKAIFAFQGSPASLPNDLAVWLTGFGAEEVQQRTVLLPLGRAHENAEIGALGLHSMVVTAGALGNFAKSMDGIKLSFPKEELDTLPSRLERELEEKGGFYALRSAWARKP